MITSIQEFMPFFKRLTVQDFENISFAMIKPDAMSAKEEIIADIEARGFEIMFASDFQFSEDSAKNFYYEHHEKGFCVRLVGQMTAGPVEVLILRKVEEGKPCFALWRETIGATNPANAEEGTLRYKYTYQLFGGPEKYAKEKATNCFHGADSVASVIREANLVLYDMYLHCA